MPLKIKNTALRLKFRLLVIGLISLLWIGCSTNQMRNITGTVPVNAYSIIQGLVTGGSIVSRSTNYNLSRITFEDGTHVDLNPTSSLDKNEDYSDINSHVNNLIIKENLDHDLSVEKTNSITTEINHQEADLDGLYIGPSRNISLVTDSGIVLQTGVFDRYTETGKLHYRFTGDFPKESMRLRILEGARILEVAMGSLDKSEAVIDVPELDLVNSILATRMIEQTREYKTLKNKGISSFVESMKSLIELRITENPDKNLLIENINRVGINKEGNFQIFPTSYDPFKYRDPDQAKDWERLLFEPDKDIQFEQNPSDYEIKDDNFQKLPIKKELVNWIRLVTLIQNGGNRETKLFEEFDFSAPKNYPIYNSSFTLKIFFKESLPLEFRNSLSNDGLLRIHNGDSKQNLLLSEINIKFKDANLLELEIDLSNLTIGTSDQPTFIFLQHTFPNFQIDKIAQAFFKVSLEYGR